MRNVKECPRTLDKRTKIAILCWKMIKNGKANL